MRFKDYLIIMAIATAAAWVGWIVVLFSIDPTKSGPLGFVFFYSMMAVALLGTLSIAMTGVRVWAKRDELVSRHVARSFRQGILVSSLFIVSLVLLSQGLFTWWVMVLLLLAFGLVELIFMSAARPRT